MIAIKPNGRSVLKNYNAHYATGSKAFTETLRKIIGARGSAQFKYFNSYGEAEHNAIDVLIADESHRIRITSANRFTPASKGQIYLKLMSLSMPPKCAFSLSMIIKSYVRMK